MEACPRPQADTEPIFISLTEAEALLSQAYRLSAYRTVVSMWPLQHIWSALLSADLSQVKAVGWRVSSATHHRQDIVSLFSPWRDHKTLHRVLLIAVLEGEGHPRLSQLQAKVMLWSVAQDDGESLSAGDLKIIEIIVSITEDQITVSPSL